MSVAKSHSPPSSRIRSTNWSAISSMRGWRCFDHGRLEPVVGDLPVGGVLVVVEVDERARDEARRLHLRGGRRRARAPRAPCSSSGRRRGTRRRRPRAGSAPRTGEKPSASTRSTGVGAADLGHLLVPGVHVGPPLRRCGRGRRRRWCRRRCQSGHVSFLRWSIQARYSASTASRRSRSSSSSSCWAPMSSENPIRESVRGAVGLDADVDEGAAPAPLRGRCRPGPGRRPRWRWCGPRRGWPSRRRGRRAARGGGAGRCGPGVRRSRWRRAGWARARAPSGR